MIAALLLVAFPAMAQMLVLERTIDLPGVQGRIDHMDLDLRANRLYIAGLGADSLEVVDLNAGKRVDRIGPLHEPRGVVYSPSTHRVFVANGTGGDVQAFNEGKSPAAAKIGGLDDADNLRLDEKAGKLYAGYGRALAVLDANKLQVVQRIALAGHPEAFQLESEGKRIFVNVPTAGHIAVIDRARGAVVAAWPVTGASRNFAMTLDEPHQRLFVATRQPARMLVYDTATGHRVAELAVCGDVDDLFFDAQRQQVYAVCGEGAVDVVRQLDPDHYGIAQHLATSAGARTGLFVAQRSLLIVAAPSRGSAAAQVRLYSIR
jgi:DNA-binding beta-propeller fold protein YncE